MTLVIKPTKVLIKKNIHITDIYWELCRKCCRDIINGVNRPAWLFESSAPFHTFNNCDRSLLSDKWGSSMNGKSTKRKSYPPSMKEKRIKYTVSLWNAADVRCRKSWSLTKCKIIHNTFKQIVRRWVHSYSNMSAIWFLWTCQVIFSKYCISLLQLPCFLHKFWSKFTLKKRKKMSYKIIFLYLTLYRTNSNKTIISTKFPCWRYCSIC